MPQTRWLESTETHSLTIWKPEAPNQGFRQGQAPFEVSTRGSLFASPGFRRSRLSSPYVASPRFLPLSHSLSSVSEFPFFVRTPVTVGGGPSRPQHDLALANDDTRHPIRRYGRICRVRELRLQHSSQGEGREHESLVRAPLSPLSFTGCFCGFFRDIPPPHPVTLVISWRPLERETLSLSGLSQLLLISPSPPLGPLVNVL